MSLDEILVEDEVFGKRWVYREEDVKEAVAELKKRINDLEIEANKSVGESPYDNGFFACLYAVKREIKEVLGKNDITKR